MTPRPEDDPQGPSDRPSGDIPEPPPIEPDPVDWSWVLERPCADCGFRQEDVAADGIPRIVRDAGRRYAAVLGRVDVRSRPAEGVWSPLEYACHVRDVCSVMQARLEQILAGEGVAPVHFANWDQDAAAVEQRYWASDPATVRTELERAFEAAAVAFERPRSHEWDWVGIRGDGHAFTALSLGRYLVHDLVHHLWDVKG